MPLAVKTIHSLLGTGPETDVTAIVQSVDAVVPGALFFAISGSRVDGHALVDEAFARGARAAVVEKNSSTHPNQIRVPSTREALARAACEWNDHPSRRLPVVGVTGTNGKTTTTYLLRQLAPEPTAIVGTVETWIGPTRQESSLTTPDALTLQGLLGRARDEGCAFAAIEVSSIALDQYRAHGTRFAAALFTNLTQDHLDYHGDMERYYRAKRRLFEGEFGKAILNVDDEAGRRLAREVKGDIWTYSISDELADVHVAEARCDREGIRARVRARGECLELRSPLVGTHNLYNLLGVTAAALVLGYPPETIEQGLSQASGAPGRLERVPLEGGPSVFVDYAHTDDALENVLSALKGLNPGRIVTVFGCGGDRDRSKRPRMAQAAARWSEVVVATSDNPRTEAPDAILDDVEKGIDRRAVEYHREADRREAIRLALSIARPDDVVLVAGKGHETYQIVGFEKRPFDDRLVVRDAYRALTNR